MASRVRASSSSVTAARRPASNSGSARPNPIDQMKFFELIQIVPSPTRSALASGNLLGYRVSDPRIMGYLRNNSVFTFGQADRAKTSATFREILNAIWLFNSKFERALAEFEKTKAR